LIASAPVAHADETCARADGVLRYLHVASTEHLTAMHVGDRTSESIDAGGIWPSFDGVLVRDGYGGYTSPVNGGVLPPLPIAASAGWVSRHPRLSPTA
jgi:hypothetical protein